jgi:hypothetical protein
MEFEGVFSAIVAAVLISLGVGGDWARWTNVRNESASAQAVSQVPKVTYRGPGRYHDNATGPFMRGNLSFLLESASLGKGASPRAVVPSIGFCPGASIWRFSSVGESRNSGVKIAGNFLLKGLPDDHSGDILTGEPAE